MALEATVEEKPGMTGPQPCRELRIWKTAKQECQTHFDAGAEPRVLKK